MVRPRVLVNYAIGSLLIVIFITGVRMSLSDADRYGWNYTRTIIVGTDIFTEKVSISGQLYGEAFIFITGVMLIITGLEMSRYGAGHTSHASTSAGIDFIGTKPTHWDIWYDPRGHIVGVVLDGVGITIPLTMIQKWIEETLSEDDVAAIKDEVSV